MFRSSGGNVRTNSSRSARVTSSTRSGSGSPRRPPARGIPPVHAILVDPRHPERAIRQRPPLVRAAEHAALEPAAGIALRPPRCRTGPGGPACQAGRNPAASERRRPSRGCRRRRGPREGAWARRTYPLASRMRGSAPRVDVARGDRTAEVSVQAPHGQRGGGPSRRPRASRPIETTRRDSGARPSWRRQAARPVGAAKSTIATTPAPSETTAQRPAPSDTAPAASRNGASRVSVGDASSSGGVAGLEGAAGTDRTARLPRRPPARRRDVGGPAWAGM